MMIARSNAGTGSGLQVGSFFYFSRTPQIPGGCPQPDADRPKPDTGERRV